MRLVTKDRVMKNVSLILLFALSLLACESSSEKAEPQESTEHAEVFSEEDGLSVYQLTSSWENQFGEQVQLNSLQGKPVVLAMIYSTCKAACPRLVADMKGIEADLDEHGMSDVHFVLVSIDPENDTPAVMQKFIADNRMDKRWTFLRSSEENTREFANIMAVRYTEISPIDYSHSNIISLIDENGVLRFQQEGLGVDNVELVKNATLLLH